MIHLIEVTFKPDNLQRYTRMISFTVRVFYQYECTRRATTIIDIFHFVKILCWMLTRNIHILDY